jgi:hypothetical protein
LQTSPLPLGYGANVNTVLKFKRFGKGERKLTNEKLSFRGYEQYTVVLYLAEKAQGQPSLGFIKDRGRGSCPKSSGASTPNSEGIVESANTPSGLDLNRRRTVVSHKPKVGHRGSLNAIPRGSLRKIRPGVRDDTARLNFSCVGEKTVLEDYLNDGAGCVATETTARMSRSTKPSSPERSFPIFKTMSSSTAPSRRAHSASNTFTSVVEDPWGKPITVETLVSEPESSKTTSGTSVGRAQTDAHP